MTGAEGLVEAINTLQLAPQNTRARHVYRHLQEEGHLGVQV